MTGQECLGYGKVYVWTEAIDAQGNVKPSSGARRTTVGENHGVAGHPSLALRSAPQRCAARTVPDRQPSVGTAANSAQAATDTAMPALPPAATQSVYLAPSQLTDPIFQDLPRSSRHYLAHFANRVCQDLVARDGPGSNPFRELIPLTRKHPLLLNIIVATSALHWANSFSPNASLSVGITDPGGYLAQLRSRDLVSRQAVIDALTAKDMAMVHLRGVLQALDPAGSEVTLAAMHFFVKFDLIDLERGEAKSWQAHLTGASNVLALLTAAKPQDATSHKLRDCVVADCFIYHILGSTLASGPWAAQITHYAFELLPVLKRTEVNSYLSCPSEILQIILSASQLSYEMPCTDLALTSADKALALIQEACSFDIRAWATQLQQVAKVKDVESRIHVASAHRSAVCLYIMQAVPLARAASREDKQTLANVDKQLLVNDILNHLSQIGEDDPYFKASSWPTFIAGAETTDNDTRMWTMTRLMDIWKVCPWGYVFTAIEMLKATWEMQDRRPRNEDVNWLQGLKEMGFENLIV
ncbi:acriflavine sensitivity control protein [Cordyceps fumosorosea ARSEF 2679]|uniref:Acriflavine sensitivity control protein n=1 Tax=Cordyceps fumosorosea (strain ARSEF 2679) TaxID=1081104 RepID=A0A168B2H2_CORFA|nr:acriflavine sensitivity control protein [Cordyceps fumosorosea ARSEF 2679]OAA69527.1 acriflavine sensitivity control protein [Cordyceps fumosorosea ARSEF 2679]